MEIVKRKSIPEIYRIKCDLLQKLEELEKIDNTLNETFSEIHGYRPYDLMYRLPHGKRPQEKYVDRDCWEYLIRLFELEKYMLCTDFEKLQKQIENFDFPEFNIENANGYIASLKDIIYDNIKSMMKSVYDRITQQTYYTGSGYSNRHKKKRNNNGVDKHFIITTNDWHRVFSYWTDRPTVTDDLEKLCYILNGKSLPAKTLICQIEKKDEKAEAENEYFKIKCMKNGNTHYWLTDDTRNKLNLYGPEPGRIGENIRIKVFS